MSGVKKLAVVIGHNSRQQGAVRKDTGVSEYIWNGKLADIMESLAGEFGIEVKVFRREYVGSYSREIDAVYGKVDRWGPDGSLELHFNGNDDPKASGTEMLSSGTARSLALAQCVQNEVVIALGLRDRGVHTVGRSDLCDADAAVPVERYGFSYGRAILGRAGCGFGESGRWSAAEPD